MAVQLKSGCITKTAEGDVAHDVTFTHSGRLLLTVTPKGELVLGEGLSKQAVTQQIGSQLVEQFGLAWNSRLRLAEDRISAAEAKAARLERQNADLKAQIVKQEGQIARLQEAQK